MLDLVWYLVLYLESLLNLSKWVFFVRKQKSTQKHEQLQTYITKETQIFST